MVVSTTRSSATSVGSLGSPMAFSHANFPQPVPTKRNRPKYRLEDEEVPVSNNIMYDRRVVRGNTYQAQVVTQSQQREADRVRREQEARAAREAASRRRHYRAVPSTPPPVKGRFHMEAQTDEYLEELTDRPIEKDADTQTQAFLDRPPSPLFVPAKCGMDKGTQIEVGDLFDFNTEVIPILEVLVGKTLEVAMFEVMEEEEIEALRKRQQEFEKMRNAELTEVQRLEAEARRRDDEKLRRLEQEKEHVRQRRALEEKVMARSFAKSYLNDIEFTIFAQLEEDGIFYDPVKKEIETIFLPWVFEQVITSVAQSTVAEALADEALFASFARAKELLAVANAERAKEAARLERELAEMRQEEEEVKALLKEEKALAEAAAAVQEGEEQPQEEG